MEQKFKRKIIKVARSAGLTVPAFLIREKKIEMGKTYDVTLSESLTHEDDKE